MALRALNTYPEKELGRGLDGRFGIAADPVIIGRRILERRSVGSQKLTNQLVHRQIALQAFANPAMEDVRAFGLDQPAVRAEDVSKFESPEIVEFGTNQQPVDDVGRDASRENPQEIARTSSGVGSTPKTSR